jgi:3-dehydroquinate synthase
MQEVRLDLPGQAHSYSIYVGSGLLGQVPTLVKPDDYSSVFIVTDEHVAEQWLPKLEAVLPESTSCVLSAGEQAKHIDTIEQIWSAMRQAGCDRKSLVIILGGGVLGDMAGFAASTYMRGVAFVHIPTTIVAQVDSSAGGKTGFDFDDLKNLIGTFAQPSAVVVDTDTLATLPERELVAGFAEMFKHGLIRDAAYFDALSQKPPQDYTPAQLADFITRSARIKATIVTSDERESGERKVVNFGHTVGHAVEALSWETEHQLLHGEAVAIGMVVEAELSQRKGYLPAEDVRRIRDVLSAAGLPIAIPQFPIEKLLEKMALDKKNERGRVLFTLLEHIGAAVYNQIVEDDALRRALIDNMEHEHAD